MFRNLQKNVRIIWILFNVWLTAFILSYPFYLGRSHTTICAFYQFQGNSIVEEIGKQECHKPRWCSVQWPEREDISFSIKELLQCLIQFLLWLSSRTPTGICWKKSLGPRALTVTFSLALGSWAPFDFLHHTVTENIAYFQCPAPRHSPKTLPGSQAFVQEIVIDSQAV